jgi:hypothetical protein
VFATYNIVAGSVQLDLNGNASASYGSPGDAAYNASVRITGRSSGPLPVDDTTYLTHNIL